MDDKPYHHEDLRRELLRQGRTYIAEHGHASLSVRALAKRAGVSPGAPYHHFPNRRSLLVALAVDGFEELNDAAEAAEKTEIAPIEKLRELARLFFAFARANPNLLELMYDSELTRPVLEPALANAEIESFATINRIVRSASHDKAASRVRNRSLAFWATLYGYGSLTAKSMLKLFSEDDLDMELDAIVIDQAVSGL